MSFMPINLATAEASVTGIAHQVRQYGVGGGKGWKRNFKRCPKHINIANIWGDYAKVDGMGKGKG
ncbi:hypothetical protein T4E_6623 [Trichinella pseudospiralis]|uniref:Uncharacterized protein n=1 Tax=Trichinella pseudospiralis TaxID=6337 RepID=A0A0V0XZ32_TRIPS|nr:hypothetical protein T4E_6623 [Trichinella pseudospiralis]